MTRFFLEIWLYNQMGENRTLKTTRMGDSDSVRFSDGEYIEGMTLTQHLNQMKLFSVIAAAAVIGTSLIAANPAATEPTAAVPAQANLAFKEAVIRNHPLTALAEMHGA